jgi:tetratricopeptide (TPR) repeat protein
VAALLAAWAWEGRAAAGDTEEARAYADKATAAFALTHYAAAAESFEKAFELKPDPALLYNAAQSHRLAGNKERALALYRNYLRLYAKKDKRPEIEARIDELEKAIAHDKAIESRPPNTTEPLGAAPAAESATPPVVSLAPPPPAATAPTLVAQPTPPAQDDSLDRKPWFWLVTAGGVAAAVTVVLVLSAGGSKDPSPSIGRINGN